jgi:glycosyltransferase involved in cell wall biosynthesis
MARFGTRGTSAISTVRIVKRAFGPCADSLRGNHPLFTRSSIVTDLAIAKEPALELEPWEQYRRSRQGQCAEIVALSGARQEASALLDRRDMNSAADSTTSLAAPVGHSKVAIVSFLFNWPSTGGGIVHTVELAQFLARSGYDVRLIYARYEPWGIGGVHGDLPFPAEALEFSDWTAEAIQSRFRQAVEAFAPDHVIITDSWNFKPLLAEAVRGYPYSLRFQAMECLCPLNNVRLLADQGGLQQCSANQLAHPETCRRCIQEHGSQSGGLHQAERELSGVGRPDYHPLLLRVLREAESALVVNPLTEALIRPYCPRTRVVTAGMDPARFSRHHTERLPARPHGKVVLFFAGLPEELMKGFAVLREACRLLWQRRQDFELLVTSDPPEVTDPFVRYVGWQAQANLPRYFYTADMVVVPTVAQEALGRTAVEAMGAGRPVVASRMGGLPFTVLDGVTGLLCEPGDPMDLARKIERLLDDHVLRERLGQAGRRRFQEHYDWNRIIERHYRPLLRPRKRLSVIVNVFESYEVVRRQLLYLGRILTPDCELIMVDDGSAPSLRKVCETVHKPFDFLLHCTGDRRQWTQPRARNIGASLARADKLLFFDIDHILTRELLALCLDYEGDKLHWLRRPGVLGEEGEVVTNTEILAAHGMENDAPSVHANSFMIRKPLFERLGGYDEHYCGRYGGDDIDFNSRYDLLCTSGQARPAEIQGEGYYYPDPALDKAIFHSLDRGLSRLALSAA